ncbi:MAG: hypothetical protein H6701_07990 [Myxococcales bacterium]|nr:hypothetical protein [Myxococcales bacterium]MCB9551455.1 hypothetical protein [Myxococcales bacterium]
MMLAWFSTSGAQPERFGFYPVESITSPPDEAGEISWSTSDMILGKGWIETTYDEQVVRALFGAPRKLAPDVRGWAFAHVDAPECGILLVPKRGGVIAGKWSWGNLPPVRDWEASVATSRTGSAWLNALAAFQREVYAAERAPGEGR